MDDIQQELIEVQAEVIPDIEPASDYVAPDELCYYRDLLEDLKEKQSKCMQLEQTLNEARLEFQKATGASEGYANYLIKKYRMGSSDLIEDDGRIRRK